jgi:hypothetical protein
LTPESIKRAWVLVEIGAAWSHSRRIVPLFYHVDPTEVPDVVRDIKGYHLDEMEAYLSVLGERVKK